MSLFTIKNNKYDINYNLNFISFSNFIQSLKESKKYYHDLCKKDNINIHDFDYQYVKNINILQGELLKYFILISNDNHSEKYINITDDIRDFYNFMIEQLNISYNSENKKYMFINIDKITAINTQYNGLVSSFYTNHTLVLEYVRKININNLTKFDMSLLLNIYLDNYENNMNFRKEDFLNKFKISGPLPDNLKPTTYNDINDYHIICYNLRKNINEFNIQYNQLKIEYLNSIDCETIYERELRKLLNNLYDICLISINENDYPCVD